MLQVLKEFSLINKVFNVSASEWSRIAAIWLIRLFYRLGFVIAWTILVAMFVSRFGIAALPYLFVVNAVLTILGTFVFSNLLMRFDKSDLFIFNIFASGVLIFTGAYLFQFSELVFFAFLIFTISVFLTQIKIAINSYSEEIFTPLQSERVFPLLESSETVGGIIGGMIIFLFSSSIDVHKFSYVLVAAIFAIVPLIFYSENFSKKVTLLQEGRLSREKSIFSFKNIKLPKIQTSYLRGIFLVVFLQWFIFNLLEFQYTKVVYQNVSGVVLEAGSGFEHVFIHDLGALFILFSTSALIVQLFLGSRIINFLGVIGSMLLHSLVTFLGFISLVFSFNFLTAVLTKNNFTISSIIFNNAYHSSYYAVNEKIREQTREFLEGIVRPIGAIGGTFALILLQKFFDTQLIFFINVLMLIATMVFIYSIYFQQSRYTKAALEDLLNSSDKRLRMNAIDILAQKGHKFSFDVFSRILLDEKENISLRIKILRIFAELKNFDSIPSILECFKSSKLSLREAALDCLFSFKKLKNTSSIYVRYRVISSLKSLYEVEKNEFLLIKIISLLAELSTVSALEFLLEVLKTEKGDKKLEALYSLSFCSDVGLVPLIAPYLDSKSTLEKIYAVVVLFKFREMKTRCLDLINHFILSKSSVKLGYGLFAIGELKMKNKRALCFKYMNHSSVFVRMNAALALVKMGYNEGIPVIINIFFTKNYPLIYELRKLLRNLDVRVLKNIDKIIFGIVHNEIKRIIDFSGSKKKNLSRNDLLYLKHLYSLAGEYDEVEYIEKILTYNKKYHASYA